MTLGVGALSGLLGSAMQIAGPPVIVYWLGSASDTMHRARQFHRLFRHLGGRDGASPIRIKGLLTPEITALALLLGPLQIVAQYAGTRLFHFASARTYRLVSYGIITLAALVGMPLLDRWLH